MAISKLLIANRGEIAVQRANFHTRWLEGWLEENAEKLSS
jgi:tRNA nucleotidyltransferase (CCA-adding enzyme)